MTPQESSRAIGLLETALTELAELRGENNAQHRAQDTRLTALEANHDILLRSSQQQGQQVAIVQTIISRLPCERHARRISEALRRLGAEEVTGKIEIARTVERHALLRTLGRVGLALLVAAIGLCGGYLMR